MAAMRGRRPRAPQKNASPPRRPDLRGMPKLAAIKLEGDWRAPPKLTRKGVSAMAAVLVLVAGAGVAGAVWLGGSLFDARQEFAAQADTTLASMGFGTQVAVEGVVGARADEVRAAALDPHRASLLAADPGAVKARVESLDWVGAVRVERRWPNELRIRVERRAAFARWQENGVQSVIDVAGERLFAERAADHLDLPLVVGRGAAHAAEPVLRTLEDLPALRARTAALVRVGERRWNVELASGATIALPEARPDLALATLERLQARYRLLDRPVAMVDLRTPGLVAVRADAPLAGGPSSMQGV